MNNETKLHIQWILNALIVFILNGTLLQTFLLENGLDEQTVTFSLSVLQIVQMLTIFLFSGIVDKMKRIKKLTAFSFLICVPMNVYFLWLSFVPGARTPIPFLALGSAFNIFLGLYNVISYKLPYSVIEIERYGIFTAYSGLFCGVISFIASVGIVALQSFFSYFAVMRAMYILSLIFTTLALIITLSMKENQPPIIKERTKYAGNILKYKPFTALIIPNILRGFCFGMLGMASTIGYFTGDINSTSASVLVTVTTISSISGSLVYTALASKVREKNIINFSSILIFISMSLMVAFNNTVSFIVFYGLAYFFLHLINTAVPIVVVKIVDYDIVGQYSGWRMLLHTLGISLSGFVCIPLFNLIGVFPTMLLSGATQLVSGIAYHLYLTKSEREKAV